MSYLVKSIILTLPLCLAACASQESIDLSDDASVYKCLIPKHKTVIAMHWDTCPLLGIKPQHSRRGQNWEVIPIISSENQKYYSGQKQLQSKLDKERRDCSWPSRISEIIDLEKDVEVHIKSMYKYRNPSYQGVGFNGELTISGKTYFVEYRGNLKESRSPTGYNIDAYFESCAGASNKSSKKDALKRASS